MMNVKTEAEHPQEVGMLVPDSPVAVSRESGVRLDFGVVTVFIALNLGLVVACILIVQQNRRLRTEVTGYEALLTPEVGSVVPPIAGLDWMGSQQNIVYGEDKRPTLIYMFSMECRFCRENWHAMHSFQALAPQSLRMVYVDTIGDVLTSEYLKDNGIGTSPALIYLSPSVRYVYQARLMPQILLVDRKGRLLWSHIGELTPKDTSKALTLIQNK